jgi:cell wall-associated NlpC family hydrolase
MRTNATLRERIVELATEEVGYSETPMNTNKTKYGKWFGLDGVAWCGMFCSWVYDKAGVNLGRIGFLKGFAGCQTAVAHFRKTGEVTNAPQPGDLVFFDWNKDGRFDHVGIFCRKVSATYFETIEGNTSITNQSNGGQVMLRRRSYGTGVLFVSPKVINETNAK